ncbi:bifunctional metallophosphatase/5'-nucleotidase [Sneathiella aquimaris]|uniref:bifunctional metallophosphatase/5'-nucleotidase n=1 Tax=Sneathiella aquimaris TaxID=2599305 RepID=UPI00146DD68A|nr:bifunctional UDP-sugar hydrolase/5'-nucleotidase [Sneathiella aquimaris]
MKKTLISAALTVGLLASTSSMSFAEQTLSARAITPNSAGALSKLYVLNGNSVAEDALVLDFHAAKNDFSPGQIKTLRVLHINDLHSHLIDFHRKGNTHRFSQISKIVKDARRKASTNNEAVLFLSMGDEHIGTVWDELLGSSADDFKMSASYRALSAAGLDMSVVGNHELDKGSELLARAIEQDADFPVLTANLAGSKFKMPWAPAAIGEVNNVRIGFIGLTSIIDTYLQTEADPGLKGYDPVKVAKNMVRALDPHVDVILLLSHVGYNGALPKGMELKYDLAIGDKQIAEAVSEVATKPVALLGGHTHTVLNENALDNRSVVAGVPIVQAGEYGKFVGDLKITLSKSKSGEVSAEFSERLIATKGRANETVTDLDLKMNKDVLDPIKTELDKRLQESIGVVLSQKSMRDDQVILDRYTGETAIANFMNDAVVARSKYWATDPVDFAAFNATGMRGVDMNGDLTYDEWYKVMPYADEIYVYSVTGAELKAIIQDNARRIVRPEELQHNGGSLDPEKFIPRGFQHYSSGIRYEIFLGNNAMETVAKNITLNGTPIDQLLDRNFRIAFNSYVANGREGYSGGAIKGLPAQIKGYDLKKLRQTKAFNTYLLYRGQIMDYIRNEAGGIVGPETGAAYDGRVTVSSAPRS